MVKVQVFKRGESGQKRKERHGKEIVINGVKYSSVSKAARELKFSSRNSIYQFIKSKGKRVNGIMTLDIEGVTP